MPLSSALRPVVSLSRAGKERKGKRERKRKRKKREEEPRAGSIGSTLPLETRSSRPFPRRHAINDALEIDLMHTLHRAPYSPPLSKISSYRPVAVASVHPGKGRCVCVCARSLIARLTQHHGCKEQRVTQRRSFHGRWGQYLQSGESVIEAGTQTTKRDEFSA